MTNISALIVVLALAYLVLRRSRDVTHLVQNRIGENTCAQTATPDGWPHIVVLLPLYKEETVVAELLSHFAQMRYPLELLTLVIVTTAKESPAVTEAALDRGIPHYPGRFVRLRYTRPHAYRARQLNFALERCRIGLDPESTYIAVYNADSRPDLHTFEAVAIAACEQRNHHGLLPPVYQQFCHFRVPDRYTRQRRLLAAAAALQTFWLATRHLAQLRRYSNWKRHWQFAGMPASTMGHGEFFRLSALESVGGFPDYAYADGLLIGWEMILSGFRLQPLLTAVDHADVPPSLPELIRQHSAWMTGLANIRHTIRRHAGETGSLRFARLLVASQWLTMVVWAMRTPSYIALGLVAGIAGPGWLAAAIITVLMHSTVPVIATLASPRLRPLEHLSLRTALGVAASAPLAAIVDGSGFWRMLVLRARRHSEAVVPAKTAR